MTKTPYVLIVEDDQWLAEQLSRTLKTAGVRSQHIEHALGAIDMIDVEPPDVIVLDVLLAGPNAFVLLHELRSHTDLAAIPVILCTNSASDLTQEDVAAYGVKYILDKTTMKPEDVIAAVKRVLP